MANRPLACGCVCWKDDVLLESLRKRWSLVARSETILKFLWLSPSRYPPEKPTSAVNSAEIRSAGAASDPCGACDGSDAEANQNQAWNRPSEGGPCAANRAKSTEARFAWDYQVINILLFVFKIYGDVFMCIYIILYILDSLDDTYIHNSSRNLWDINMLTAKDVRRILWRCMLQLVFRYVHQKTSCGYPSSHRVIEVPMGTKLLKQLGYDLSWMSIFYP